MVTVRDKTNSVGLQKREQALRSLARIIAHAISKGSPANSTIPEETADEDLS